MSLDRTIRQEEAEVPVRSLRVSVVEGPDCGIMKSSSDVVTVGTDRANDLVLTDNTVSRHHLDVVRHGDRIHVIDHESTNGTILAGAWLKEANIQPGLVLKLGRTAIKIDDGNTISVELHAGDKLGQVLGRTPAMRQLMARIKKAAQSDTSILLLGETGTGKEIIARAIHDASGRADRPFEIVDCGAVLPTLIASQLFGHERGSFTGADQQHIGAFERADSGTLFIDEIGELPAGLQTGLLGALERRSFRRLGGKSPINVDVRVVCATNRDLRSEVNAGGFREDLYYRIAVILLRIPPLRERIDDLPLLAHHFLEIAGHDGPMEEILPPKAMQNLMKHRWPGNVRELRNAVEAAMVMGEPPTLAHEAPVSDKSVVSVGEFAHLPYSEARERMIRAIELVYLNSLLERTGGNVSEAARAAQMNRSYLTRMLKRHGIRGQ